MTTRNGTITVTLRLPDPALSPNARGHWAKKARHAKAYRGLAYTEAMQAQGRARPLNWPLASIDYAFYWPPKMRMWDDDNSTGAMKSARDGLADAGIVKNDRHFRQGVVTNHRVKALDQACVVMTVTALAPPGVDNNKGATDEH